MPQMRSGCSRPPRSRSSSSTTLTSSAKNSRLPSSRGTAGAVRTARHHSLAAQHRREWRRWRPGRSWSLRTDRCPRILRPRHREVFGRPTCLLELGVRRHRRGHSSGERPDRFRHHPGLRTTQSQREPRLTAPRSHRVARRSSFPTKSTSTPTRLRPRAGQERKSHRGREET
jgi:hypothetical protein